MIDTFFYRVTGALRRHPFTALVSTAVVALGLALVALSMWMADNVEHWSQAWQHDVDMVVYFDRDVRADRVDDVASALESIEAVERVERVSPELALTRLRAELGDDVVDGIDAPALPASVEVVFSEGVGDVALAHPLVDRLRDTEGVAEVEWVPSKADELLAIARGLDAATALTMVFSLVACGLLIFASMRWRAMANLDDERVLAMLGASRRFVVWPRTVEGFAHGLVGAALALALCWLVQLWCGERVSASAEALFGVGELSFLSGSRMVFVLGLGAGAGFLGGLLAAMTRPRTR